MLSTNGRVVSQVGVFVIKHAANSGVRRLAIKPIKKANTTAVHECAVLVSNPNTEGLRIEAHVLLEVGPGMQETWVSPNHKTE